MATIAGIATGDSNFSILVNALVFIDANVEGSDLVGTLSDPGQSLTVFAPTNDAFGKLAVDLGFTGDSSNAGEVTTFLTSLGAETLNSVVLYHVSGGVQSAADITSAGSVVTLEGNSIDASELPTLGDLEPDFINPSLAATDIAADNGVVHVIDRVLLPFDLEGNDAPSITEIVLQSGTGFDSNGNDFDILREAVVTAGLAGTLDDDSADFTAFAPVDSAFVGLSQALGYADSDEAGAFSYLVDSLRLLNNGDDPVDLLTTVLTYHVAPESLQASQVIAGGSVSTLQGGTLNLDGLSLVDADPDIPNPSLIATDIQASNGVVHVLDGVLLPVDVLQSDGSNAVDFVIGDSTRDRIVTGKDNDLIDAKGGNDVVVAGSGDDLVLGGDGRDVLLGGAGDDTLKGEAGNDRLLGHSGNDNISGGAGNDTIFGGLGNDTISGGAGNDIIFSGQGADIVVFAEGDGQDKLFSFNSNQDKIDISALGFQSFEEIEAGISGSRFKTEIDLGDVEITLIGTNVQNIGADDFIFA